MKVSVGTGFNRVWVEGYGLRDTSMGSRALR